MKRVEILCIFGWVLLIVLFAGTRASAVSHSSETDNLKADPGTKIVFSKGSMGHEGIRAINPDGSGFVQLTHERSDMTPQRSPDGSLIAFLTMKEADFESLGKYRLCMHRGLYVMDADGKGQRRIADVPVMMFYWSPDSKSIAFTSGYEDTENFGKDGILSSAVYMVDIHSKKIRRLTEVEGKLSTGLSWSPDANQIACSKQVARRVYDIFIVNVDGSGSTRIANGTNPKWSPDGKRILFTVSDNQIPNKTTGIHSVDIDGGHQRQVTTVPGYARLIAFSPEGERILYSTYDKSADSLYVMDAGGSNKVHLSKGVFKAIDMPQFIGNGSRVFFAGRKDEGWNLFSVNVDGSEFRHLAVSP